MATVISLLCPTRGRSANVRRFATSARQTAQDRVEIVFYVDDDDLGTLAAVDEVEGVAVIGPRIVLSECWNRCAQAANGQILGHMGDDIVFHTPGWDHIVRGAFEAHEDRICFVHGRDGLQDERLGTHGFLHRKWVDAVGYFCPPYFAHDCNDTWLTEVADLIGRRVYLPDLHTEHLHPDAGKAELDDTYREHAEAGQRDNVAELYASLAPERQGDARKLRAVMA